MLKKIGIPVVALLGMLAAAPHQAKAGVRIGIGIRVPAPIVVARPVVVAPVPAPLVVGVGVGPVYHPWFRHDRWFRR